MKEYFILSLKHSPHSGCAVWWGPNNAGYYMVLSDAGRYSEQQVRSNPSYYDNGDSTRAIPCEQVEAVVMETVDWSKAKAIAKTISTPSNKPTVN